MKRSHIIALIIIAVSIGIFITTMNDASTYVNFETAIENQGKTYHVVGELAKDKEMEYNPEKDPNYFSFFMEDKDGIIKKVILRNTKPRDIERSENIVAIGSMNGEEFIAESILMKCPSKYVKGEQEVIEAISQ